MQTIEAGGSTVLHRRNTYSQIVEREVEGEGPEIGQALSRAVLFLR